jgi:hypothetical protein
MRQLNNNKSAYFYIILYGYYLLGNNDSYEGGKSLSTVRISVPLESGGAVATMAIVSKLGTGCISEE